jgi:hypothetical protein
VEAEEAEEEDTSPEVDMIVTIVTVAVAVVTTIHEAHHRCRWHTRDVVVEETTTATRLRQGLQMGVGMTESMVVAFLRKNAVAEGE